MLNGNQKMKPDAEPEAEVAEQQAEVVGGQTWTNGQRAGRGKIRSCCGH